MEYNGKFKEATMIMEVERNAYNIWWGGKTEMNH
jgi:hypothetical protein